MRRAHEIFARSLGGGHRRLVLTRTLEGGLLRTLQRFDEAIEVQRAALEAARSAYGDDHRTTATVRLGLGHALAERGDSAAALPVLRRGRDDLVLALGDDHPDVARARLHVAEALAALGQYDAARVELGAAAHALQPHDSDLGYVRLEMGRIARAQGSFTEAVEQFQAAIEIARATLGESSELFVEARADLEQALLEAQHAEAGSAGTTPPTATATDLLADGPGDRR